ncbi:MAG: hypothetical protein Q9217_003178 [Psora testacea]
MLSTDPKPPFALANSITGHLAVLAADAELNPPPSYLYIQDCLVTISGISWILAYIFYALRAYRDKRTSMPTFVMCMRLLGTTIFGFGTFWWRYLNVPENWGYFVSPPSLVLMAASSTADLIYPVVYHKVWAQKVKASWTTKDMKM